MREASLATSGQQYKAVVFFASALKLTKHWLLHAV